MDTPSTYMHRYTHTNTIASFLGLPCLLFFSLHSVWKQKNGKKTGMACAHSLRKWHEVDIWRRGQRTKYVGGLGTRLHKHNTETWYCFLFDAIGDNLDFDLQLWEVLNHLDTIKAQRQAEEISQTDNETTDPTDGNEIDLGLRGKSDQAEGEQILEGATCRTRYQLSVHVLLLVWCSMDSTPYMKCIQVSFLQIALILCQTWQLIKAVPIVLHYLHVDKWSYSRPACSLAQ